ncbi:MAG: hypothetical protein II306_06055 [Clostridia bacterium]|nr:hypothetical protein [Clostridia bacterium]MEE1023723.1 hypothetical protein [Acutalibacteraceae bacterium]
MDKNVVLCENCNTVNDQSSRFCRYCGKELVTPVTVEQTDIPAASPTEPENKYGNTYTSNEILGVPEAEMAEFVGKNSDKVMKNFIRMRDKNSKISFNLPVFLLGLLVSPIIAAGWFFYRRMNKIGAIVLCIGLLFTAADIAISVPTIDAVREFVEDIVEISKENLDENGDYLSPEHEEQFDSEALHSFEEFATKVSANGALSTLLGGCMIAFVIILSLRANYMYMSFAASRIKKIKQAMPDYPMLAIKNAGSTAKGGMIGVICGYIAIYLMLAVTIIVQVLSTVLELIY